MKKFLILTVAMLSLMFAFVGCNPNTPKAAAETGYKALATGDDEAISKYFVEGSTISEVYGNGNFSDILSEMPIKIADEDLERLEKLGKDLARNFKFVSEVVEETEETAVVKLTVTFPDMVVYGEELADSMTDKLADLTLSDLADLSSAMLIDILIDAFEAVNIGAIEKDTVTGNVNMKLVEGQWKIDGKETLLDSVMFPQYD